jgi:hypothetical protein
MPLLGDHIYIYGSPTGHVLYTPHMDMQNTINDVLLLTTHNLLFIGGRLQSFWPIKLLYILM